MRIFAKIDETAQAMTPRTKTVLSKTFSSDSGALEDFYIWLEGALHALSLGKKEADRVILAVAEAFSNAIQHGNRSNPKKKVQVHLCRSGNRLDVWVGDEGEGSAPHSSRKSELFDTSGRGWEMMHQLAEEVSIRRENGAFWVELSFKMPKNYKGKPKEKRGKKGVRKVRSGGR
ncbi:MAG TPA: ATP-binding protein [candidate division Zixibacteria bacterium]|nr:ATP-binding protein [candidate division Zixibacteria bacterium]